MRLNASEKGKLNKSPFSLLTTKWKTVFRGEGDAAAIDNVKQRRGCCEPERNGKYRRVAFSLTYIIPNHIFLLSLLRQHGYSFSSSRWKIRKHKSIELL